MSCANCGEEDECYFHPGHWNIEGIELDVDLTDKLESGLVNVVFEQHQENQKPNGDFVTIPEPL